MTRETAGADGDGARRVIAIDGPSGSGKSTVARGVARRLTWRYLDTGAMYRALTWLSLQEKVATDDDEGLVALLERIDLRMSTRWDVVDVHVGARDVTAEIRGAAVTGAVSAVSARPGVRARLVEMQRALAADGDIVVEGRDIGTVVLPHAPVKVYLTADTAARARRRVRETATAGRPGPASFDAAVTAVHADIDRRDRMDSARTESPLRRADDATAIDTTDMTADEVVEAVVGLYLRQRSAVGAGPA